MRFYNNQFWTALLAYLSLVTVWFGFMCIVNWDYDPGNWSTLTRTVFGVACILSFRTFTIKW